MRSFLSLWMPWQSSMGTRGRPSSSSGSNRSMCSMSGSGVSRCRLLQSLSAGLLVAGVGVPSSHCSVTSDDFDLTSWLSPFGESSRRAIIGGVRSAEWSSNCSELQIKAWVTALFGAARQPLLITEQPRRCFSHFAESTRFSKEILRMADF